MPPYLKEPVIMAVIFDLNEVSLNGLKASHSVIASRFGITVEESWNAFHYNGLEEFFCGAITEDELLARVIGSAGWKIRRGELKQLIRGEFGHIEGTREIIEALRRQYFKLALLSDHGREWAEHCEKEFGHHKLYDHVVYSYEIGTIKKNPATYEHILKILDEDPEDVLFIDDREPNIRVAEALGIRSIMFTNADALRESLTKLGIEV